MIKTDQIRWVDKEAFYDNVNTFNARILEELEGKPYVLYQNREHESIGVPCNMFTMGLYRYGLPEIHFKNVSNEDDIYDEMVAIADILIESINDTGTVVNVETLPDLIKSSLSGVEYKVGVIDTEEFFYGYGTPHRYFVDGNYKYINVIECIRSETPCQNSSKVPVFSSITT